jgi:molybdate transport system ATP-binding protein
VAFGRGAAVTAHNWPGAREPTAGLRALIQVRLPVLSISVELSVRAGSVLAVLGPNGAGKTTLLRALAGLQRLDGGSIELDGETLDDPSKRIFVPPERREVGVVFQDYRLFPHLSVLDNIGFGPRSRGSSRPEARRIAREWLPDLGLQHLADRRPQRLSGGEAQRVALGRALAGAPELLLLDEPMSALDVGTRFEVRAQLHRHLRGFAGPVLLVTHDPLEAMMLADALVVVESGVAVQQGTPAEVSRRPATQYVARLIGLNLYPGRLAGRGIIELDDGGRLVCADQARTPPLANGQSVLAAIRPAAITLYGALPGQASSRNVWPGRVIGMELVTDRVRLQVDGRPAALVDVTAAAVAELGLGPGTPVWLSAKATDIDVYPSES